ncbi:MAG: hypothetical protein VB048_08240 [Bacteroidaceae bacterium]|nr:hypothetical protein [Bacteroidaceae bacterium]
MAGNNFFKKVIEIIALLNTQNYETKIDFVKTVISDTQDTIRAVDIKTEILLGILVLVMTGIFTCFYNKFDCLILLTMFFWLISVVLALCVLYPFDNPCNGVKNPNLKGLFYGISFMKKGKIDNDALYSDIKELSETDLLKELVFDFSKLIYIRDRKIKKFNKVIIFTTITIFLFSIVSIVNMKKNYDNPKNDTNISISNIQPNQKI